MQGKELSEQATTAKSSVGIDVGKAWLDIHVVPQADKLRVENSRTGLRRLKRWLGRFAVGLIVIEATGKWHRQVRRSLIADGFEIATVDPYRARMFAKATGVLAKTDALDARLLALYGALLRPQMRAPAPAALEALAELVQGRDRAVAEQTALKNQRASAQVPFLKAQLARRIAAMARTIAGLDAEIARRIDADPGLASRFAILTSIPSIGPVHAASLIAYLAELGACSAKQIAMLAGLAPLADDSGDRHGIRSVWAGRAKVRRVLYLAALSAARFNPDLAVFYRRLTSQGRPAKLALIAVARKLAILANTLIAQNRNWQPNAPQPS